MTDKEKITEILKAFTKKHNISASSVILEEYAEELIANGVILPIWCKNCIHAVELDKHCDISRTAYKHCTLLRGDETKYVWHKYKKYYKDYSIVSLDDFCSEGELKDGEKL